MKIKAMIEEWKKIDSFYEVSSVGNIRSIDRTIFRKNRWGIKSPMVLKGRELKFKKSVNNSGYFTCQLGSRKKGMPHRLVAEAFCYKAHPKMVVNHKNGNKKDNRVPNLEWVHYRENTIHSRRHLNSIGKKFNIPQVIALIKEVHNGKRVKDLAEDHGITRQCVSRILSGRMWPSKDYPEIGIARKKYPYVSPKFGKKWLLG